MIQPSDAHRLEIAQDLLGCLIALRSESIFMSGRKPNRMLKSSAGGKQSETPSST